MLRFQPVFSLISRARTAVHRIRTRDPGGAGLPPGRINDAVALLEASGYARLDKWMGTAPFDLGEVEVNALGRHELQRALAEADAEERQADDGRGGAAAGGAAIARSPIPRGSPFGFSEEDWEFVETEWRRPNRLKVVFAHQWQSSHFETDTLRANLQTQLNAALAQYSAEPGSEPAHLAFVALRGGYGEHLFNEIARDIISADIAIFETSDLNANVMIEMGVALTWGVRVHPIRADGTPQPPSDISGQMWACYRNSGAEWLDGLRWFADP